jgi:hypothetical protein
VSVGSALNATNASEVYTYDYTWEEANSIITSIFGALAFNKATFPISQGLPTNNTYNLVSVSDKDLKDNSIVFAVWPWNKNTSKIYLAKAVWHSELGGYYSWEIVGSITEPYVMQSNLSYSLSTTPVDNSIHLVLYSTLVTSGKGNYYTFMQYNNGNYNLSAIKDKTGVVVTYPMFMGNSSPIVNNQKGVLALTDKGIEFFKLDVEVL